MPTWIIKYLSVITYHQTRECNVKNNYIFVDYFSWRNNNIIVEESIIHFSVNYYDMITRERRVIFRGAKYYHRY